MDPGKRLHRPILLILAISSFLGGSGLGAQTAYNPADEIVLEVIWGDDSTAALEAVMTLGERTGERIEGILAALTVPYSSRDNYRRELLLRVLLDTFFFEKNGDEERSHRRMEANRRGIELLLSRYDQFADFQLRASLLRLAGRSGYGSRQSLLAEGGRVLMMVRGRDGPLEAAAADLVLAYLEAVGLLGNEDFIPSCTAIYEATRNRDIAVQARLTARRLLAGSR